MGHDRRRARADRLRTTLARSARVARRAAGAGFAQVGRIRCPVANRATGHRRRGLSRVACRFGTRCGRQWRRPVDRARLRCDSSSCSGRVAGDAQPIRRHMPRSRCPTPPGRSCTAHNSTSGTAQLVMAATLAATVRRSPRCAVVRPIWSSTRRIIAPATCTGGSCTAFRTRPCGPSAHARAIRKRGAWWRTSH